MRFAGALAMFLATLFAARADVIKVACVGDSITQGVGVRNPGRDSYPAVLGKLLGKGHRVENFGSSGATLLKAGNNPYWKTPTFREATKFKPDIVIIALGANDSKPQNWDGREQIFLSDYKALIAHFAKLPSKPKICLCLPAPSFQTRTDDIREAILKRQRARIRKLAAEKKLPLIDLETPLRNHPGWLPDGVHPNEAGAKVIATTVAAALGR